MKFFQRTVCTSLFVLLAVVGVPAITVHAQISVTAVERETTNGPLVALDMTIPAAHYVYASSFRVEGVDETVLEPIDVPKPKEKNDAFSDELKQVYDHSFTATYRIKSAPSKGAVVMVNYQGCNTDTCFFPQSETFRFGVGPQSVDSSVEQEQLVATTNRMWKSAADQFDVVAVESGFLSVDRTLGFLSDAQEGRKHTNLFDLEEHSFWVAIGLILLGGLALNLTPCVLPMLPINLAIIGAGAQAGSRKRGFLLGGIYGAGIALTYGVLGVLVVLTGSTFGSLNASPWFNIGIAVVFAILSLGMFDVIHIDFARFQRAGSVQKNGGIGLAFSMGIVAALLAGACVAPVVLSVLIWAGSLYGRGIPFGLVLPFVLGAGMALPWPFAGAGLSFLPKPGKWMIWVRNGFGVLILGMAIWYGVQAYRMFGVTSVNQGGKSDGGASVGILENRKLATKLNVALQEKRPVFLNFGASWCKNCKAMSSTTLKDEDVLEALEKFEYIYYAAEQPDTGAAKSVVDYFNVRGLPTYIVLRAKK